MLSKENTEIQSETQRARSHFFYDSNAGVGIINLRYIMPNEHYELAWNPPDVDFQASGYEISRAAAPYYQYFLRQSSPDPETHINTVLRNFRKQLLETGLNDSLPNAEALEVGLFMFVESETQIRPIAGTYNANSPLWEFKLGWGVGIRGASMRRGKPVFYIDQLGKSSEIYKKCDDCPPDKYMLAIPFSLPPGIDLPAYPGSYRLAMLIHSVSSSSGLGRLRPLDAREQVSQLAQEAFNQCIKPMTAGSQR